MMSFSCIIFTDCELASKSSEASPSGPVSPMDQQLRVSLPNSPTRDSSIEGVYAVPPSHHHHHHRVLSSGHHKHSRSRCPPSGSKRESRGSNTVHLPTTSHSQLERWFGPGPVPGPGPGPGPLPWRTNCEYVCSHCHRHINCSGQYNSHCIPPRQLGLASFESHYVVNSSYAPWSGGVNYLRGASGKRGASQAGRHCRDQCHVPVQVHLEGAGSCQQGSSSRPRDSDSASSLSLSAFNADVECSDTTSSPENFDSTQSVYGSSTTCHSEVTGCDPCVYARPGVVQHYWNLSQPVQLTPTCLHKLKLQNVHHKRSTSDSDDTKQSSDANASASGSSNFSTHVNSSRKDGIQPYKPPGGISSVTTPDSVASQIRTSQVCSSRTPTPGDSNPDTITPQTDPPLPLHRPDSSRQNTPCTCCGNAEVWESHRSEQRPTRPGEDRLPPADRASAGDRMSPDRVYPSDRVPAGEKAERSSSSGKGGRRSNRGTPTRRSRTHLTLPVQSVATLKNTQGKKGLHHADTVLQFATANTVFLPRERTFPRKRQTNKLPVHIQILYTGSKN